MLIRLAAEIMIPQKSGKEIISVRRERINAMTRSTHTPIPNITITVRYFANTLREMESGITADTLANPAFPSAVNKVATSPTMATGSSINKISAQVERFLISMEDILFSSIIDFNHIFTISLSILASKFLIFEFLKMIGFFSIIGIRAEISLHKILSSDSSSEYLAVFIY